MKVIAKLNHLRMAPRKVRLVAALIRRMEAKEARIRLGFLPKKAAGFLLKLLNSAIANGKNNFSLKEENLYVDQLLVNGGPSLKRWMPRAMGRATPILKRTSHITLVLEEIPGTESTAKKTKEGGKEESKKLGLEEKKESLDTKEGNEGKKEGTNLQKPYGASGSAKKRFFGKQTKSNLKADAKRMFRRKSV